MPSSWSLLNPFAWLETAVSGVLVVAHALLGALGLDPASGAAWVGAIVVLVVSVRLALLPLVLRQVRASHRLARIAPQLRALQTRYSRPTGPGGRQQLTRDPAELARWRAEQKALHVEAGASPLSFLPVLLQVPVMLALAHVLDGAAREHAVGLLTPLLAAQAGAATVLGAPLSGSLLGGGAGALLAVVLVAVVAVATWVTTHRQLRLGTTPEVLEGPVGQAQRMTVWVMPLVMAATSAAVPLGLLVYWASSAVWSLVQSAALLRWLPTPGTPAAAAREQRLEGRLEGRPAPEVANRP
ncbi:YidC/Oxa1 family membrane protein insertase [Quadrisphaera granulorum]|uniref:Membrane protein insertase YidC n=1 Tax=Quadrisphaera granulorum TaxID=317664 RepID=A0A316AVT1_9ACTN|nr:membrane protein insertase YidC [Quadrisphaera granulorum]PWJ54217.1 YidC/Oxa1 family membrane protein insertase [Quadrisphaera granulorum]SZE96356.1 YidC/Oxa1 family membrane protein insertase [Quadrisphaera granulorum]